MALLPRISSPRHSKAIVAKPPLRHLRAATTAAKAAAATTSPSQAARVYVKIVARRISAPPTHWSTTRPLPSRDGPVARQAENRATAPKHSAAEKIVLSWYNGCTTYPALARSKPPSTCPAAPQNAMGISTQACMRSERRMSRTPSGAISGSAKNAIIYASLTVTDFSDTKGMAE